MSRPPPIVYRVQDAEGRGPWRPGLSGQWMDFDAPVGRLSETIMDLLSVAQIRALPPPYHYGCACRSYQDLLAWFQPAEMPRLHALGFYPVKLAVDHIVVESPTQLVVARLRPFADGATRLSWPPTG